MNLHTLFITIDDIMVHELGNFLSIVDKIALSQTCKGFLKIRPNFEDFKHDLYSYLKNSLGDELYVSDFLENMKVSGGYISGSAILQTLYNEKWESDIDVVIPIPSNIIFWDETYSIQEFDQFFRSTSSTLSKCLLRQNYDIVSHDDHTDQVVPSCLPGPLMKKYGFLPAASVKFIKKANGKYYTPINIIYVENSVLDYINYYFDFSICKNAYNGDHLFIHDLNGILERTIQNNTDYDRYTQRFISKQNFDENNCINVILKQAASRKDKYKKRGFQILDTH